MGKPHPQPLTWCARRGENESELLDTGHWSLVTGHWSLVTRHSLPLLTQYPHVDRVVVCAVAVDVFAQAALFDEAGCFVCLDPSLVARVYPQPDAPVVAVAEGVVDQQRHSL